VFLRVIDYDLTAVIPARLGSSRITEKVFQSIDGKETLLSRKIKQLRKILPSEKVVVNTESEKIADHALANGATVHWRDPYYSDGHKASFSELIVHVISQIESKHIAWTPFVVPFFSTEQYLISFENYKNNIVNNVYDSLVSVVSIKDYIWDEKKPLNYIADHRHTISQELPNWFQVTNGNYMAPKSIMLEHRYILGQKVFLDVRDHFCKIDIDTLHDLKIAKAYQNIEKKDRL
jgi:CMP-N-acetylneuraminic acid synthetase